MRHRKRRTSITATTGRRYFALAFLCVCAAGSPAAVSAPKLDPAKAISEYVHDVWHTEQGLPQNSVRSIAQTADGCLWLATEQGLARYDGAKFTIFDQKNTPAVSANEITTLLVDAGGTLWIGTHGGGLSRYAHGEFSTFTAQNGLPANSILSLYFDKRGVLWIGTDGSGLYSFASNRFTAYTTANGLPDNSVFAVAEDAQQNLWVGTRKGLRTWDHKHWWLPAEYTPVSTSDVRALQVDQAGTVWVGTNGDGLYRLASRVFEHYTTTDGLSGNAIWCLLEDSARTLWVGTAAGGLSRLNAGRFSSFHNGDVESVWSLFEDREGSLWAGTSGGGLSRFKNTSFTSFGLNEGLSSDIVLPVFQDSRGVVWIGTTKGLNALQGTRVKVYTKKQGLPDDLVMTVAEDRQNRIWAGTRHGLVTLEHGIFVPVAHFPQEAVFCTLVDHAGDLWIGSRSGLTHFLDAGHSVKYTTANGLTSNAILALFEDDEQTLWIGTSNGLNRLSDDHVTIVPGELRTSVINALFGERNGPLWIGTTGAGLFQLDRNDGRPPRKYTVKDGLIDNSVFAILDDQLGNLWLTSNKGVYSVAKRTLAALMQGNLKTLPITLYGASDGMRSTECNGGFQPAAWKMQDGRLAFPTMKGAVFVNPAKLVINQFPPPVAIESIVANHRSFPAGREARVPPGAGQLELAFTSPSLVAPEKIRFKYRLEGFDDDWTEAGGWQRTVQYTNIPPGSYRFSVIAANNDGIWSAHPATLRIVLQPHFYQTKPFISFWVAVIAWLAFAAHRLRVHSLKKREEDLQVAIEARTSELKESTAQFRQLAENIREIFWTLDPVTRRYSYVSSAFEQIWEAKQTQLLADPEPGLRACIRAIAHSFAKSSRGNSQEIRTSSNTVC